MNFLIHRLKLIFFSQIQEEFSHLLTNILIKIEYQERVSYQRFFDLLVDLFARMKAWRMVDFEDVRLHFAVDENVHAEDLKARLNHVVRWKARVVVVLEHRQGTEDGFDDDVVDVRPKLGDVVALVGENAI